MTRTCFSPSVVFSLSVARIGGNPLPTDNSLLQQNEFRIMTSHPNITFLQFVHHMCVNPKLGNSRLYENPCSLMLTIGGTVFLLTKTAYRVSISGWESKSTARNFKLKWTSAVCVCLCFRDRALNLSTTAVFPSVSAHSHTS